jgi:hypothetical protein
MASTFKEPNIEQAPGSLDGIATVSERGRRDIATELGSADLEPQAFCRRQKFGVDAEICNSSDVISTGTSANSGVLR